MKRLIKNLLKLFALDIHRIPPWETNRFLWLKDYNIKTILDIGAHVGNFALEINGFLPNALIYSFEPLKNSYNILLKNTHMFNNIRAFNVALGDYNGDSVINRHDFSPASSLLKASNISKEAYPRIGDSIREEIQIKRLDDFINSYHIEIEPEILVKMDVQGFEDKVIRGGNNIISKSRVILTEVEFQELYDGQLLFSDINAQLISLGFEFKGVIETSLHPKTGMPLFADAIFIKR